MQKMVFGILVNNERITLQTETIIDDLSQEPVHKNEIETLAIMLAERFAHLKLDTLLIQGLSNTLTLTLMLAAWRVGLRVAFIRSDASPVHFEKATEKLGNYLHIFYDLLLDSVLTNTHCLLEKWVVDTPSQALPTQPFHWDENNVALIFFTSGSTGLPKGVCHSLPNLLRSTIAFKEHYNITSRDNVACFAELHTNTGIRTLALALLGESSVVFIRKHKRTQSHELSILKCASYMICGPYMVEVLLRLQEKLDNLVNPKLKILSLGSYLPPAIIALMYTRHQIPVLNFYGLTETFGFALADKEINTQDCLPPPCKDVSLSLLPISGESKLFYLEIISPNLFLGYLGEPLKKKTVFNTEDVVLYHDNGQLQFMGRASGAAKAKNGEWIFPLQLEIWLRSQSGIRDVVVKINPPLTAEHLLSIFITVDENFTDLTYKLTQQIITILGRDYQSIAWHQATIVRSIEGKIKKITPVALLEERIHA